jgi:hypothetical protein
MEWVDRASAPGLGYGISKEEIDQWSAERKAITAQGGRLLDAEFPTVLHATPLACDHGARQESRSISRAARGPTTRRSGDALLGAADRARADPPRLKVRLHRLPRGIRVLWGN